MEGIHLIILRKNLIFEVAVRSNDSISYCLYDIVFVCNGHFFDPRIPLDYGRFKGKLAIFVNKHISSRKNIA